MIALRVNDDDRSRIDTVANLGGIAAKRELVLGARDRRRWRFELDLEAARLLVTALSGAASWLLRSGSAESLRWAAENAALAAVIQQQIERALARRAA